MVPSLCLRLHRLSLIWCRAYVVHTNLPDKLVDSIRNNRKHQHRTLFHSRRVNTSFGRPSRRLKEARIRPKVDENESWRKTQDNPPDSDSNWTCCSLLLPIHKCLPHAETGRSDAGN